MNKHIETDGPGIGENFCPRATVSHDRSITFLSRKLEATYKDKWKKKEKGSDARINVDGLFELASLAFAVEIALAVARKDSSAIQIKNKHDLYQARTDREMFDMILE